MRNILKPPVLLISALAASLAVEPACGQEATVTSSEALKVPVFDSIDENSVDLVTGMLRIRGPLLTMGSGDDQVSFGFEWTGRSWRMLGLPMINRDDGKYYVTYDGVTEEFNSRSNGFTQRKPITGSTLHCGIWSPENYASNCTYINRHGDVLIFRGKGAPMTQMAYNYGMQTLAMGNMGMSRASVTSGAHPGKSYGNGTLWTGFDEMHHKPTAYFTFGNQQVTISTPNHSGSDYDDHYLRPDNVTQTFTDDFGTMWRYVINDDREITNFYPPGGLSPVSYTYTSEHRVTSVTNAAGVWSYSYSSLNGYRTITVTTPTGRQYSVKSHIDNGYVVEHREITGSSQRVTTYDYDSGYRLWRVTYPELNRVELQYDARGNVLFKRVYAKPGSSEPVLVWETGGYEYPNCTERVLCNLPTYIIDPEGNRTDFEYAPHATTQAVRYVGTNAEFITVDFGHGKPVVVRHPAPSSGAPGPTVRNTYVSGYVATTSTCITEESCAGTADEVRTEYEYAQIYYAASLWARGADPLNPAWPVMQGYFYIPRSVVETGAGLARRTCNEVDQVGRIIATTPPGANLTSCPVGTAGALPNHTDNGPGPGYAKTAPTFPQ